MMTGWDKTRAWLFPGLLCFVGLAIGGGCGRGAQRHLDAGIETLREGDFTAAVTLLELAAESRPDDPSVHCNLGLAYWKLGQTPRAIWALKKADRLSRGDERPLEFLGQIYVAEGALDEAREAFEQAGRKAPLSPRIFTSLAVVANYAGEVRRAKAMLENALELNPAYAPAIYNMGVLYRGPLQDDARAAVYFERYLRIGPDGDRKEAVREWMRQGSGAGSAVGRQAQPLPAAPAPKPAAVARTRSEEPPARAASSPAPANEASAAGAEATAPAEQAGAVVAKARQAIERKELDTALVLLTRCVEQVPESADALWLLAVLYDRHLAYKEQAEATYETFKQRFPDDPRARTEPLVSRRATSPSAPVPEEAAPRRDPGAARRLLREGVELYQAREWEAAIAAYKQALSLDPQMIDAFYNLGLAYKASGNPEKARVSLSQAIALNPDMLSARYMLAVVYRDLDDLAAARAQLDVVLENDPHYAKAHLLVGLVYRDLGRREEARRHFQRYLNMEPDSRFADELKAWMASEPESS